MLQTHLLEINLWTWLFNVHNEVKWSNWPYAINWTVHLPSTSVYINLRIKLQTPGEFFLFLVLYFPLYLYSSDLQNITNFGFEINVFLYDLQHLENITSLGLLLNGALKNNCQYALKCVSIMTSLTLCKYVGRIHCVILCDTTQDSQEGKKKQHQKSYTL